MRLNTDKSIAIEVFSYLLDSFVVNVLHVFDTQQSKQAAVVALTQQDIWETHAWSGAGWVRTLHAYCRASTLAVTAGA